MDSIKEWVKPFLLSKFQDNGFSEEAIQEFKSNLQDPKFCQVELTKFFSHNFDEWSVLFKVFGKVLAQLPKKDFQKISRIRNLILICPKIPGGCVESLKLPAKKGRVVLITFDRDLISRDEAIIIGIVAHELAHLRLGHPEHRDEVTPSLEDDAAWLKYWREIQGQEPLADGQASLWGFGPEITLLNERRREDQ